MKHTLLAAAMALSVGALLAQAEPGGQDGPLTPITAAVADSETDAQTDIEAFLKDKDKNGFGAPINAGVNKKDDGSVFVVSTGIGIVAAPITHPSFGASRARAFDRVLPERVEIGVVAIWSPKLAELADAMVSGRQIVTEPGKPLAERIPSDRAKLLNTFGTQVVVDEHGEMVLVSYGQSAPRSSSGMSIRMARNNARLMAETQIRAFAEEEVAFNAATDEAEKTMDLEGMGQVYVDESTAADFRKTYAKSMTLSGITQYTTWNAKHPQSGKIIYGSICVWSPSQALVGKALREGWKSKEGPPPNRPPQTPAPIEAPG